jgi:hypothetical protein
MMARKEYMTPEQLREILSYDAGTGELTWKFREAHWFKDGYRTAESEAKNWNGKYAGKRAGYLAPVGYRYISLPCGGRVPEHRVIWAITNDVWPDVIDHINGDPLDNAFTNLRNVTQGANMSNARMWSHNTSGVTGVYWDKKCGRWVAKIKVDSKTINLKSGPSFDEAAKVRKEAEAFYEFTPRHGI